MSDMVIVKGNVSEDGQLIVELPSDTPHGEVEVIVRKIAPVATPELTPEEEAFWDAEFEKLINDPKTFTGLGLTIGEIAQSPEIGIWADREDMADPVAYLEEMRRKRRQRRLNHD
jgi:hypothetical protein